MELCALGYTYVDKKLAMCLTLGVRVIPVASANVELDALCSLLQAKIVYVLYCLHRWAIVIVISAGAKLCA